MSIDGVGRVVATNMIITTEAFTAGPRVIEQTVREQLPEGFQRSEFLLQKGAIDMIVDRKNLKMEIAKLIALFQKESLDAIE